MIRRGFWGYDMMMLLLNSQLGILLNTPIVAHGTSADIPVKSLEGKVAHLRVYRVRALCCPNTADALANYLCCPM